MGERVRRCRDCDGLLYWVKRAARGTLPKFCAPCRAQKNRAGVRKWREADPERARVRWRQYREDNREEISARRREVREAMRETREAERTRREAEKLRWRQENPEAWKRIQAQRKQESARRASERNRRWREENAERRREYMRQWRRDNPHKRREQRRRRRAIKRSAHAEHFAEADIYQRDNGRCQLKLHCTGRKTLKPGQYHLDHIIPLSRGGSHTPANVQIACAKCNTSKGARAVGEQLRLA